VGFVVRLLVIGFKNIQLDQVLSVGLDVQLQNIE